MGDLWVLTFAVMIGGTLFVWGLLYKSGLLAEFGRILLYPFGALLKAIGSAGVTLTFKLRPAAWEVWATGVKLCDISKSGRSV